MADGRPARPGTQRTGGRSARVRSAVLDATIELLSEMPYDALTVEEVAARAGVHKTTVYRRWPTKLELVTDATLTRSEQAVPIPDTGSLQGDLQALARSVAANIGSDAGGRMTRSIVGAAATSPDVAKGLPLFWSERLGLAGAVVDRAIARGELPPGTDGHLLIETLIGPLYVRLLLTGEPVTHAVADQAAAIVAAGATATSRPSRG